jgi:dTDP-4-dehydrorhamnose 3,5-epimerase
MIFRETAVAGAWVIEPEPGRDERGSFTRIWDAREFADHGLASSLVQCSLSATLRRGTLRGLHYQVAPHEEAKLVRPVSGAVFDVALDLRLDSPTFKRWYGVELSAENGLALYVPEGCAHGLLTLSDETEVLYQMSAAEAPSAARGVRYDDPAFGIEWPAPVVLVNDRDRGYADFERESA